MFAGLIVGLVASPAYADDGGSEERKRALALQVMEVTGATAAGSQVVDSLMAQIKPAYPTVPEELWVEVSSSFDVDEIIELSIPIYMRNFNESELAELVAFYQSSLGRKVIERMPVVMQESMLAFNGWNRAKAMEVIERLKAKGYEPSGISPPAE
jgi:hypothetical protein